MAIFRNLNLISVSIKLRLNPLLKFVILEPRSKNTTFAQKRFEV